MIDRVRAYLNSCQRVAKDGDTNVDLGKKFGRYLRTNSKAPSRCATLLKNRRPCYALTHTSSRFLNSLRKILTEPDFTITRLLGLSMWKLGTLVPGVFRLSGYF